MHSKCPIGRFDDLMCGEGHHSIAHLASGIKLCPMNQECQETLLADMQKRTVLFSFVTIFLLTNAIRHLLTRAWVRSGGASRSVTTCSEDDKPLSMYGKYTHV